MTGGRVVRALRPVAVTVAVAMLGWWFSTTVWGWDVPAGIVVHGIVIGSLTALLAVGLALTYRSNRVVNFAAADMGAVPASLLISLLSLWHWPFLFALPVALAASYLLGSLTELLIVRRFKKAPRLILMVATVGVAQVLAGLGAAIPYFMGEDLIADQTFPPPFDFSFEISPQIFHANELMAVIATVLAVVLLWAFLRYTSLGIAIRASAESSDRASLLGINVGLTHNIAWGIAGLLAGTAMILRAGMIGLPLSAAVGPSILLRALTAAVIGRMERFTIIFIASCGIGVVETLVLWNEGSSALVDPAMFVIVIVALLLQRRDKESRVDDQAGSSWQNVASVRPIPRELLAVKEVRRTLFVLKLAFVAALLLLPFVLSERNTNLAAAVAIYAAVGASLVLLTGWAGEISLGQVAFVAIGSAAAGAANVHWQLDPVLSFLFAGLVGAVASILIGLPALRIRGLFLAVTTLAFAVATSSFLLDRNQSLFGVGFDYLPDELLDPIIRYPQWTPFGYVAIGEGGVRPERAFYYFTVIMLLLVLAAMQRPPRAARLRDLVAQRENDAPPSRPAGARCASRLLAFALSGFFASFAGGVLALHQRAARRRDLRADREHPRADDGRRRRVGLAARHHPRRRLPPEHRVVQRRRPRAVRFLVQSAGGGIGLLVVLMVLPGGLGSLLYRRAGHVVAVGGAPPRASSFRR